MKYLQQETIFSDTQTEIQMTELFQHLSAPHLMLKTYIKWTVPAARSTCTSIRSAVKMKLTVVTTVLLGLLLTPALAEYFQNQQVTREIRVNGGIQFLSINPELRVVTVEQRSEFGPWKTIWNFNTGFIATELMSEGICVISQMNRNLLPTFETFPTVIQGFQGLKGQIQPTRVSTFVFGQRVVPDLRIYGPDIFNTCRESTTVVASPVPQLQPTYNEGACTTLDVLNLVQLNYCRSNVNVKV
ncbi:gastrokine-1-like [Patagioenas fasciata]|uniref:gastrokine-1-like n=1 Tax=Patagioenas fasciata TaxID=372321 RepID=UPI003A99D608